MCDRICQELDEEAQAQKPTTPNARRRAARKSEPLLWMMHGGPGVGKSEVLKLLRQLFEEVCGFSMGVEYQMAALQAVMAEQLGGDTLHHCCGISRHSRRLDGDSKRQSEVAKSVLQWRWLIYHRRN